MQSSTAESDRDAKYLRLQAYPEDISQRCSNKNQFTCTKTVREKRTLTQNCDLVFKSLNFKDDLVVFRIFKVLFQEFTYNIFHTGKALPRVLNMALSSASLAPST